MNTNDISEILYYILIILSSLTGIWNLLYFKEFKKMKVENELLKLKLERCEQRRT
ncbi:MAG: hypothetical protein JWQ09_5861 [Segetibacter sp.]|nr:hypothetical protein [Segetibacter sp.]